MAALNAPVQELLSTFTTSNPLRILIVEDNEADVELIRLEILRIGVPFECAYADSERTLAQQLQTEPQIIISDYNMPGFTALDVLDAAKKQAFLSTVIVVSGHLSDQKAAELFRFGAADYLLKDRMARLSTAVVEALIYQDVIRKQKQAELELAKFFEISADMLAIFDLDGYPKRLNAAWVQVLGFSLEEVSTRLLVDLVHADDRVMVRSEFKRLLKGGESRLEARFLQENGSYVWLDLSARTLHELQRIFVVARDITESKKLKEHLEHQANYDSLTGLMNRRSFEDHFERITEHRRKSDARFFLVFMDVNKFKSINDTYGHSRGDELLMHIANRLNDNVRDNEAVARMGGDEFVMLLQGHNELEIKNALLRLTHVLELPYTFDDQTIQLKVSMGVAQFGEDGETFAELLRVADQSMYRAKQQGGGVSFHTPGLDHDLKERLWMERALQQALENDGLNCHFQPIVDLQTNDVICYEAYARWTHPERGQIRPLEFIEVAEEAGLMARIDYMMIRCALEQAREAGITVVVNVAAKTLQSASIVTYVKECLQELTITPELLHLDISELVLAQPTKTLPQVKALRELGVRIAIDDFGTGHSALAHLSNYPIDLLKLDISFVRTLEDVESARTIAEMVIRLAHNLNLQACAEGVENEWQLSWLKQAGCDLAQGYFLGEPVPVQALQIQNTSNA